MQEYSINFRILFCSDSEGLIQNLNQKIEEILKDVPYELKVVKDGVRAINELGKNFCQLFITDSNPVGINIHYLLEHFQDVNGGGYVIVLKNSDTADSQFENCEVLNWPITSWNEFEDHIKSAIPEELKIKYGLTRKIPLKFQSLNQLVQQYKDQTTFNSDSSLIIMPPIFFEKRAAGPTNEKELKVTRENVSFVGENNKKFSYIFEILMLVGVMSLNYYFFNNANYESESIFSVRVLTTVLSGFIFFVLVSNWTIRRYIMQISIK